MNIKLACPGCGETIRFRGADTQSVQHAIDALQAKLGPGVKVNVDVKLRSARPWWKFWSA